MAMGFSHKVMVSEDALATADSHISMAELDMTHPNMEALATDPEWA